MIALYNENTNLSLSVYIYPSIYLSTSAICLYIYLPIYSPIHLPIPPPYLFEKLQTIFGYATSTRCARGSGS